MQFYVTYIILNIIIGIRINETIIPKLAINKLQSYKNYCATSCQLRDQSRRCNRQQELCSIMFYDIKCYIASMDIFLN